MLRISMELSAQSRTHLLTQSVATLEFLRARKAHMRPPRNRDFKPPSDHQTVRIHSFSPVQKHFYLFDIIGKLITVLDRCVNCPVDFNATRSQDGPRRWTDRSDVARCNLPSTRYKNIWSSWFLLPLDRPCPKGGSSNGKDCSGNRCLYHAPHRI